MPQELTTVLFPELLVHSKMYPAAASVTPRIVERKVWTPCPGCFKQNVWKVATGLTVFLLLLHVIYVSLNIWIFRGIYDDVCKEKPVSDAIVAAFYLDLAFVIFTFNLFLEFWSKFLACCWPQNMKDVKWMVYVWIVAYGLWFTCSLVVNIITATVSWEAMKKPIYISGSDVNFWDVLKTLAGTQLVIDSVVFPYSFYVMIMLLKQIEAQKDADMKQWQKMVAEAAVIWQVQNHNQQDGDPNQQGGYWILFWSPNSGQQGGYTDDTGEEGSPIQPRRYQENTIEEILFRN